MRLEARDWWLRRSVLAAFVVLLPQVGFADYSGLEGAAASLYDALRENPTYQERLLKRRQDISNIALWAATKTQEQEEQLLMQVPQEPDAADPFRLTFEAAQSIHDRVKNSPLKQEDGTGELYALKERAEDAMDASEEFDDALNGVCEGMLKLAVLAREYGFRAKKESFEDVIMSLIAWSRDQDIQFSYHKDAKLKRRQQAWNLDENCPGPMLDSVVEARSAREKETKRDIKEDDEGDMKALFKAILTTVVAHHERGRFERLRQKGLLGSKLFKGSNRIGHNYKGEMLWHHEEMLRWQIKGAWELWLKDLVSRPDAAAYDKRKPADWLARVCSVAVAAIPMDPDAS